MNLNAFANIDGLESVVKENGIYVPRLRGYSLMKDQTEITDLCLRDYIERMEIHTCVRGCRNGFSFNGSSIYSSSTRNLEKKYLDFVYQYYNTEGEQGYMPYCTGIRWDRIHGKKRKALKFEIKKMKKSIMRQAEVWNSFCGREDVLYAHSRIGGGNWNTYREEVQQQQAYLCKVDDAYDSTYCDLYFRIKVGD